MPGLQAVVRGPCTLGVGHLIHKLSEDRTVLMERTAHAGRHARTCCTNCASWAMDATQHNMEASSFLSARSTAFMLGAWFRPSTSSPSSPSMPAKVDRADGNGSR